VTGRLEQRSYETAEGEKRNVVEIVADEVGPSLRWATAEVTRIERTGSDSKPAENGKSDPFEEFDKEVATH
jgi:single-strand DNA-binding protein